MKATELRIGNWIKGDDINMFKVDEIRLSEHQGYVAVMYFPDMENILTLPLDIAQPIPLTEELLLGCGFKKEKDFSANPNLNNKFLYVKDSCIIFCMEHIGYSYFQWRYGAYEIGEYNVIDLKYVHQLQNLYYALTNEELVIKL